MKKLIGLLIGLALASGARGQAIADYAQLVSNFAVRLDGGTVVSGGSATITGGTCTNQVATAIDTSGVPTCANISSAMIPAATVQFSDIADGSALTLFGRSANSAGVMAGIAASAASGCAFRESGSVVGCGTLATAAYADDSVTLAKMANAAANSVVLGAGPAGSGANYVEIPKGSNVTVSNNPAGSPVLGFDPRTQFFWYEEFGLVQSTITDAGSFNNMAVSTTNTPTNFSVGASTASHPGVVIMSGNAGSTATMTIRTGTSSIANNPGLVGECMVQITTLAQAKTGCGFGDNTASPVTATDGMLLFYDASDTHWQIINRQASTGNASVSNLVVTAGAGVWHRLTVYVESLDGGTGGSVHYYVDGTELNVSPLATNVPQGAQQFGYLMGWIETAGATAEMCRLDYMMAYGPISR